MTKRKKPKASKEEIALRYEWDELDKEASLILNKTFNKTK